MVRWYRPPGVAFEYHGDSVYVLDLRNLDGDLGPRALQGPAARIWSALGSADDPRSEEDLVRSVANEFGIDVEEVRAQTIAFLWDLEKAGLARQVKFEGKDHDGPL